MGIKHIAVKESGSRGYASEWNDDHKIDGNVNFEKHQALSLAIESRTDWPTDPVEGQIIYRSDLKQIYIWNGSAWVFPYFLQFYQIKESEDEWSPTSEIVYSEHVQSRISFSTIKPALVVAFLKVKHYVTAPLNNVRIEVVPSIDDQWVGEGVPSSSQFTLSTGNMNSYENTIASFQFMLVNPGNHTVKLMYRGTVNANNKIACPCLMVLVF